jgi:hypothetical protein
MPGPSDGEEPAVTLVDIDVNVNHSTNTPGLGRRDQATWAAEQVAGYTGEPLAEPAAELWHHMRDLGSGCRCGRACRLRARDGWGWRVARSNFSATMVLAGARLAAEDICR